MTYVYTEHMNTTTALIGTSKKLGLIDGEQVGIRRQGEIVTTTVRKAVGGWEFIDADGRVVSEISGAERVAIFR